MASYYVWSGATGSANGTNWANAYTTLATALTGKAAGDVFYLAHDHSESTAAQVTLGATGTLASPNQVICVNRSGSVPPVSADLRSTAQVATTGNNNILFNAIVYYSGIIFTAGNSTGSASLVMPNTNSASQRFDNCSLRLGSTGGGTVQIGAGGSSLNGYVELRNTTASFSATAQAINVSTRFVWRDTASALIGAQVPTNLFTFISGKGAAIDCAGVDLSAAGSGKILVAATAGATACVVRFMDCKLNASVTKVTTTASQGGIETDFIRSASSGVNYTVHRDRYAGTLDEETTIVRTGGASDGTTSIAWKIVTTANSTWAFPFEAPPIAIWNDTTGSAKTATIEGIWGGGAVPNNDDVWLELEYLGDASSPQGSFVSDGKADVLAAAAAQDASSATWGGSTTKFKLVVTFTAQQKGWVYARVKAAKLSSTFYIDPLVTLT